jgi:ABC-type molybdenum transport system ATPase subunit/photorepair protein PhrA
VYQIRQAIENSIKSLEESSKSDVSSSNLIYSNIGLLNHSIRGRQVHHIRPLNLISSASSTHLELLHRSVETQADPNTSQQLELVELTHISDEDAISLFR